jgi:hypothetical protein
MKVTIIEKADKSDPFCAQHQMLVETPDGKFGYSSDWTEDYAANLSLVVERALDDLLNHGGAGGRVVSVTS